MIALEKTGALWTLRLNRPYKANSLTGAMLEELVEIVADARYEARAVILTGTGRVFSAGADLDEARAGLATATVWEQLSGAIASLPCFTVAALNGTLAGGAFGMALACDARLAVPDANFFYPVMKLGFLPQPSDPARLCALVGPARARVLLTGGARIGAETARDYGLIEEIVEPADLLPRAAALCADALSATPEHAARIRAMTQNAGSTRRDPS